MNNINRTKNVRFAYFRDPKDARRVLTIGYLSMRCYEENLGICCTAVAYQFAVNKVVDKSDVKLDDRLRLIMTKESFNEMQSLFRKRFGGDQHNKKLAKNVIRGRFSKQDYHTTTSFDKLDLPPVFIALIDIERKLRTPPAIRKIVGHHIDNFVKNR